MFAYSRRFHRGRPSNVTIVFLFVCLMSDSQPTNRDLQDPVSLNVNFAKQSGCVVCVTAAIICCFFPFLTADRSESVRIPVDPAVSSNPDDVPSPPPVVFMLDLNHASTKELTNLPTIGEKMAERIVDYREENGEFAAVDELLNVRGIGPKTLEKIRPFCYVTLENEENDSSQ